MAEPNFRAISVAYEMMSSVNSENSREQETKKIAISLAGFSFFIYHASESRFMSGKKDRMRSGGAR